MNAPSVKSVVIEHNGAGVCWVPLLKKFAIIDAGGHLHGYRNQLSAAREFAASLPGSAPVESAPAVIPRSPHALPVPEMQDLPPSIPRDERRDLFERRAPRVITPFERSRALCRRQAVAHERVYSRHRRRR